MAQKAKYFAYTKLFAKEVIECSTQYGEDGRSAYVAENLCDKPTIYPNFEDSTRSCAFVRSFHFKLHWPYLIILF